MRVDLKAIPVNPTEAGPIHNSNNEEISAAFNLQGANVIFNKQLTTSQAVTSTSFVAVTNFITSLACTGGLLKIICDLGLQTSAAAVYGTVQMYLDGLLVDSINFGSAADIARARQTLRYEAAVQKGQHKLEIKAKTSGGTLTITPTDSYSALRVVETVV